MSAKWSKLKIEFTDADDHRKKDSFAEPIETDQPLPIPAVGDDICLSYDEARKTVRVERRLIYYHADWTHVQLFCREVKVSHE